MALLNTLKTYLREIKEDDDLEAVTPEVVEPQKPSPAPVRPRPAERRLPEASPTIQSIEVFRPSQFDDCQYIADALKRGHAAIVNYYYTLESTAKRIRCFMSGCIYAQDGFEEAISDDIVLYTSRHTGIQSKKRSADVPSSTLQIPWEKNQKRR